MDKLEDTASFVMLFIEMFFNSYQVSKVNVYIPYPLDNTIAGSKKQIRASYSVVLYPNKNVLII